MTRRAALTDAELERIAELTEDKRLTIAQIARLIGCSDGSVYWAQLKIGADKDPTKPLPPVPIEPVVQTRGGHIIRRFTQAEDAELLRLEGEGVNPHSIGRRLLPPRRSNSVIGRLRTLARRAAREEAIAGARP